MNLFGTAGVRGPVRERVTPELALQVGRAAALAAGTADGGAGGDGGDGPAGGGGDGSADPPEFVLGRDGRETGGALADAVAAGLRSGGADVRRVGRVPTPALAFASRGRRGVMVTASHNPPADNGLKLFVDGVEYDAAAERAVEDRVDAGDRPVAWDRFGGVERTDVLPAYRRAVADHARGQVADADATAAALADGADGNGAGGDGAGTGAGGPADDATAGGDDGPPAEPLSGLRVLVDCGNGMAGRATPQVLRSLGATVLAVDANVDGHFPARDSKPTAESLAATRRLVAEAGGHPPPADRREDGDDAGSGDGAPDSVGDGGENGGDDADGGDVGEGAPGADAGSEAAPEPFALGVAHDGDADRTVVLAPDGAVVHEDTVLAILAEHYVRASSAADPVVVTTPNASGRIDDRVGAAGGRVERVRLGYLHEGVADARREGGPETRVVFAGEPWKHLHTAFGDWLDGVATAAVLSTLVARTPGGLATLRAPVAERPYRKRSVDCPDRLKSAAMAAVERRLPEAFPDADVDTEYGVRIDRPDGSWALVRPSGTEPYLRVYAESDDVASLLETVVAAVEAAVADAGD